MHRLILLSALIAAPAMAGSDHADRITWPVAVVVAEAPPVAVEARAATPARSAHADAITWDCPKAADLVN